MSTESVSEQEKEDVRRLAYWLAEHPTDFVLYAMLFLIVGTSAYNTILLTQLGGYAPENMGAAVSVLKWSGIFAGVAFLFAVAKVTSIAAVERMEAGD